MNIIIREYKKYDLEEMIDIWNEVVEDGIGISSRGTADI